MIAYTFVPAGDGTRMLLPRLGPVIRRDVPKQQASLKALCEHTVS
jgi:hypothetical protein